VFDRETAQRFDRLAQEELGVPAAVLIENAALAVVEALEARWPQAEAIAVVCGPGNNGADGYAVARQLRTRGHDVVTLSWLPGAGRRGAEAEAQRHAAIACGVRDLDPGEALDAALLSTRHVIVDALFGVGARPLSGSAAAWADAVVASRRPVLAIDLPSGLDASSPSVPGPVLRADCTVTFVAPKVATILPPARDLCGAVVVADLGVPAESIDLDGDGEGRTSGGRLELLTEEDVARWVAPRRAEAHKGDFGHLLVVAGSPGHWGAAALAMRGALRTGLGLVTVAAPPVALPMLHAAAWEAMTADLDASEGVWSPAVPDRLLELAKSRSAVALGPGLGRAEVTAEGIRRFVLGSDAPLVLDADGLNAFAGRLDDLAERRGPTVLTPHPGEMGRLLGRSTADVQADRRAAAREASIRSAAVVLLKGHQTLIASPDGSLAIVAEGNPGMASGGMGDVLTGAVGALLARGYDSAVAAALAAYLHGAAGDRIAAARGSEGMLASEVAEALPLVWRDLFPS
jgi:NAD(P)H-hydrate epimerase